MDLQSKNTLSYSWALWEITEENDALQKKYTLNEDTEEKLVIVAMITGIAMGIFSVAAFGIALGSVSLTLLPLVICAVPIAIPISIIGTTILGQFIDISIKLFRMFKVRKMTRLIAELDNKYQLFFKPSLTDLKKIIKVVNINQCKGKMPFMTFAELGVVREVFGAKKFHALNSELKSPNNELWKMIDSPILSCEDFRNNLEHQMNINPLFKKAVYRYLPQAVKNKIPENPLVIAIKIGNEKFPIQYKILIDNFSYFRRLLKPLEQDFNPVMKNPLPIEYELKDVDSKDFSNMMQFVSSGLSAEMRGENLLNLVSLLDYFSADNLLQKVDLEIAESEDIPLHDKLELIKLSPKNFKATINTLVNSFKWGSNIKITDENWDYFLSAAEILGRPDLYEKLFDSAFGEMYSSAVLVGKEETKKWYDRCLLTQACSNCAYKNSDPWWLLKREHGLFKTYDSAAAYFGG
jgi:hypothetical protein